MKGAWHKARARLLSSLPKLKPTYRGWIYLVLLALTALVAYLWLRYDTPLIENLLAGIVEILITVFVIDNLLRAERKKRLGLVNSFSNQWVAIQATFCVSRVAGAVGYQIEDQHKLGDLTEDEFQILVKKMVQSNEFDALFDSLAKPTEESHKAFTSLKKALDDNYEALNNALKEVQPYPDPLLAEELRSDGSTVAARVNVHESMLQWLFIDAAKEGKPVSPDDQDFWPGFNIVWKDLIESGPHGESVRAGVERLLGQYVRLFRLAKKNKVSFDV